MSELAVTIYRIPIIGCPGVDCVSRPDGLDKPACGKEAHWEVATRFLCDEHFRCLCEISEWDYDDVVAEADDA